MSVALEKKKKKDTHKAGVNSTKNLKQEGDTPNTEWQHHRKGTRKGIPHPCIDHELGHTPPFGPLKP
jgi:hypothetical protein